MTVQVPPDGCPISAHLWTILCERFPPDRPRGVPRNQIDSSWGVTSARILQLEKRAMKRLAEPEVADWTYEHLIINPAPAFRVPDTLFRQVVEPRLRVLS